MVSLVLLTVVAGIVALLFTRTLNEIRHSGDDAAIVQSLMLARGAANLGGNALQGPIRVALNEVVKSKSSSADCWSFGGDDNCKLLSDGSQPRPDTKTTIKDLNTIATALQPQIDDILCHDITPTDSEEKLTIAIFVTDKACKNSKSLPSGVNMPSPRFIGGTPRGADEDEAKEQGIGAGQTYAIPFVMIAEGEFGTYNRRVVLQGEYQFQVGRASFARFGLFTNHHNTGGSNPSNVWFTSRTLFDGPVHTNQHFRFYEEPWFGGEVTSAGCVTPGEKKCAGNTENKAYFYGYVVYNPPSNPSYTNKYGTHAPDLTAGVDWDAKYIKLPEESDTQKKDAEAAGIPLHKLFEGEENLSRLTLYAGDADGNTATGTDKATHQYIEACDEDDECMSIRTYEGFKKTKIAGVVVMTTDPATVIEVYDEALGEWREPSYLVDKYAKDEGNETNEEQRKVYESKKELYANFNSDYCEKCVIYTEGRIDRLTGPERTPANSTNPDHAPPALASFAQMTVTAEDSIRISGDLKYEDRPCTGSPVRNDDKTVTPAVCDNLDADNVLGIYTPDGDVLIGNDTVDTTKDAPHNVAIDAVVMSASGAVQVEDYDNGTDKGNVNLLGGIIENYYGAFGQFSTSGGYRSGYGRSFTYDQRMKRGMAPPSFPGITEDEVRNVIPISFGQREQLF